MIDLIRIGLKEQLVSYVVIKRTKERRNIDRVMLIDNRVTSAVSLIINKLCWIRIHMSEKFIYFLTVSAIYASTKVAHRIPNDNKYSSR
jgi:hypothetical protein